MQRGDGSDAEIALDVASALFGEQTMTWRTEFLDVLATEYGAGMNTVDFANEPEPARVLINDWTAEQTHDRIPELIPEGVIDALTRLVLVNALYLKAPWETPFVKGLTAPADFQLDRRDDRCRRPDAGPADGGAGHDRGRLAVGTTRVRRRHPRHDRRPARSRSAGRGRADPGRAGVAGFLGPGAEAGLDLRLPRWTFRAPTDLKPVLQALGMVAAFEPPPVADFSAMTDDADLYVTDVLHEVFIAVDEDGTEAAAATAVVMGETAARRSSRSSSTVPSCSSSTTRRTARRCSWDGSATRGRPERPVDSARAPPADSRPGALVLSPHPSKGHRDPHWSQPGRSRLNRAWPTWPAPSSPSPPWPTRWRSRAPSRAPSTSDGRRWT